MLIKGEKYACEACVRGHRVSNCQHSDRPLQHINKKGRPVSQCTHCRTLRKSRSAHVRCDCGGEKAHTKGACSHDGSDSQADSCCCSHGARCSCALKKEHLDPVPESDSDETSSSSAASNNDKRRPRALTAQSETGLTIFTNGHHKPVHKHNNMAHKCGLPYVVPRAHSIHGTSPTGMANRSVDNLPHTSTIDALHSDSHIKDSMVSAQQEQRMVKSEHGSPFLSPVSNLDQLNGQLPPLDLSSIPTDFYSMQNIDGFSSMADHEQPMFSAGLSSTSIDWSHYDGLDFNSDNLGTSSYSQAPSFTGYDFGSIDQSALTTSTSGEISEVEDFVSLNDHSKSRPTLLNQQYGSDFDTSEFGGEMDGYRLSTASSYIGMTQAQMLASSNLDTLDMESFLKDPTTSSAFPVSNHGLPISNYAEGNKLGQDSPYDEGTNYQLLDDESDGISGYSWMNHYQPSDIALITGRNEPHEENLWAQ